MASDATQARPGARAAGAGALDVGTVVADTYEVTGLLGRGGMGAVWAARHLRLPGKRVALKVLLTGGRPSDKSGDLYARFRREAEIASRIGHPNIVEVLDFNSLPDGTPYLVLEFLEGEDLRARLERGPMPLTAALELARQLGSALHAAHRAGIVHRDLKPENVFLCPTDSGGVVHDRVKVLDFGISKIRGSQTVVTQEAVLIGTPQYMSPEQALGKNQDIDARTDVFALGAIVYEMLAGQPAFPSNTVAAAIYAVVHEPHAPLETRVPGIPLAVARALDRALAKRPEQRFATIAELVEALTGRALETLDGAEARARATGASAADKGRGASAAGAAGPGAGPQGTEMIPAGGAGGGAAPASDPWAATVASEPGIPVAGAGASARTATPPAPGARARAGATAAASRGGKGPLLILAAVVVIAAGAVWGLSSRRRGAEDGATPSSRASTPGSGASTRGEAPGLPTARGPATPPTPPATAAAGEGTGTPAPSVAPAAASDSSKQAGARADDTNETEAHGAPTPARERPPTSARQHAEAPLVPAAASDLADADAALSRGDLAAAIRSAQHSLYAQKSSRAFSLITRARCRQGDVGGARSALAKVAARDRAAVVRDCASHGLDLR